MPTRLWLRFSSRYLAVAATWPLALVAACRWHGGRRRRWKDQLWGEKHHVARALQTIKNHQKPSFQAQHLPTFPELCCWPTISPDHHPVLLRLAAMAGGALGAGGERSCGMMTWTPWRRSLARSGVFAAGKTGDGGSKKNEAEKRQVLRTLGKILQSFGLSLIGLWGLLKQIHKYM